MRISPAQAGKLLGEVPRVHRHFDTRGEISATDERMPGSKIARYRIDPKEIERWQASRTVRVEVSAPPPVKVQCINSGLFDRMQAVGFLNVAPEISRGKREA